MVLHLSQLGFVVTFLAILCLLVVTHANGIKDGVLMVALPYPTPHCNLGLSTRGQHECSTSDFAVEHTILLSGSRLSSIWRPAPVSLPRRH